MVRLRFCPASRRGHVLALVVISIYGRVSGAGPDIVCSQQADRTSPNRERRTSPNRPHASAQSAAGRCHGLAAARPASGKQGMGSKARPCAVSGSRQRRAPHRQPPRRYPGRAMCGPCPVRASGRAQRRCGLLARLCLAALMHSEQSSLLEPALHWDGFASLHMCHHCRSLTVQDPYLDCFASPNLCSRCRI